MRFDPKKALEHAELIPPGRFVGGASQEEAARVCQDFLAAQGWQVETRTMAAHPAATRATLVLLVLLWLVAGLLKMYNFLGFYMFSAWLLVCLVMYQCDVLTRLIGGRVWSTAVSARLKPASAVSRVMVVGVSLASRRPMEVELWKCLLLPTVKRLAPIVALIAIIHAIFASTFAAWALSTIWWLGQLFFTVLLWRWWVTEKRLRRGECWPENREAIGFLLELARAWAARPSRGVALELLLVPNLVADYNAMLPEKSYVIWIVQPGDQPELVLGSHPGDDLLSAVCRDLRVPYRDAAFPNSFGKDSGLLAGAFSEHLHALDPTCMALMAQVVHQAALRWARTRPSL